MFRDEQHKFSNQPVAAIFFISIFQNVFYSRGNIYKMQLTHMNYNLLNIL